MVVSEDHASCWVHKDVTVTTKKILALLTAARASGGKHECQVRLTGIEREYWIGTEISRLGDQGFRDTVTGFWRNFGDASVTIAQWRRARDLTNLGYPQVPGSIPAENPSTQINMDLSK